MKTSGVMPRPGCKPSWEARKLLGSKKFGDTVGDIVVIEWPADEGRLAAPDNAEAIAWETAAS